MLLVNKVSRIKSNNLTCDCSFSGVDMFNIEYLFVFDKASRTIVDHNSILANLKNNNNLSFTSESKITYSGESYTLKMNGIHRQEGIEHSSCSIKLIQVSGKQSIDTALSFLSFESEITKTLFELKNESIKILQNTAAEFMARESYSYINNIENKMRKLITIFMTSKVGPGWEKNNLPDAVNDAVRNQEQLDNDKTSNLLFYVDFDKLSDFLFKGYKTIGTDQLHSRLLSGGITLEEIKLNYVPRSNWSRYFEEHINKKEKYITDKWTVLYKLRNKVAHNRSVDESEYNTIKGVANDLNVIIDDAILQIDKISVSETQKEEIANVVSEEIAQAAISSNPASGYKIYSQFLKHTNGEPKFITFDDVTPEMLSDSLIKTLEAYRNRTTDDQTIRELSSRASQKCTNSTFEFFANACKLKSEDNQTLLNQLNPRIPDETQVLNHEKLNKTDSQSQETDSDAIEKACTKKDQKKK